MEVPQKIKNRTIIKPRNPTIGYFSKEKKLVIPKDMCTPMFTAAFFIITK